ncbi:MAG: type III-B CRISPR module RAMP protein Cmr1 [Candidatus Aminicenantes bacterium]|nr:type III-B CRISPR module RAMP protein Cmr1 [Candidatus Aminicenantes bacterium]
MGENMHTHTANCQIISQMFLAGADQKKPEMRSPSVKGAMRYWWRAAQRIDDVERLKRREAEIFGSSGSDVGRSKFRIGIGNRRLVVGEYSLLPHRPGSPAPAQALEPEGTFSIDISSRHASILTTARHALELSAMLGGLGRRSRRGLGSYYIENNHIETNESASLNEKINSDLNALSRLEGENGYLIRDQSINGGTISGVIVGPETMVEKHIRTGNPQPKNYPQIIFVVTKKVTMSKDDILRVIGNISHKYPGNDCGGINPRFASPVYCSLYKYNGDLFLIVTLLSSPQGINRSYQEQFILEVISYAR